MSLALAGEVATRPVVLMATITPTATAREVVRMATIAVRLMVGIITTAVRVVVDSRDRKDIIMYVPARSSTRKFSWIRMSRSV